MKKQNLQSLQLNKKIISKMNIDSVKGGGFTTGSDCLSQCLGHECQDHR